MPTLKYPPVGKERGRLFWLKPSNMWHSRESLTRVDRSTEKREEWRTRVAAATFTKAVADLLGPDRAAEKDPYSFIILGDTGEGDRSQYSLVPLIRGLHPDFMIINGDVAYPAGRFDAARIEESDFHKGFFEPYRNLGIPIWATPGNHEYYSPGEGQEFFDLFCTPLHEQVWHAYGLPHSERTRQPFPYWEIRDDRHAFSIIGLDTGKSANLDGASSWWQFWRTGHADGVQMKWLTDRLADNQRSGRRTLILFHIPALVNASVDVETLTMLHRTIAGYSCVAAVVAGHIHNMQLYTPDTWSTFLRDYTGLTPPLSTAPYAVSGSGGASLHSTDFSAEKFPTQSRFPSRKEWKEYADFAAKTLKVVRWDRTFIANIVSDIRSAVFDMDEGRYISLLHITVGRRSIAGTPYWIRDIRDLYPKDAAVDIAANIPPLDAAAIAGCRQPDLFHLPLKGA